MSLPPGPFRSRLSAITDVRAILTQARISATRTSLASRGSHGGVVVSATVNEALAIADSKATVPTATVEIIEVMGSPKPAAARDRGDDRTRSRTVRG